MKQPNLIYIFADQLRHDVFGFVGDDKAITPNIDRFAAEGVHFSNATCVSSVCTPYRASLFTGKYVSSTGMVINEACINPNHEAIGYSLHEAGYNMGYLGKWHLVDIHTRSVPQGPARLGFQHASLWRIYNFNHHNYRGYYWEDRGDEMECIKIDGYQTDAWTDMACDFIRGATEQDQPFSLFLSFSPPHDPWTQDNLPKGYYKKFADVEFPHPPNFREDTDPYDDRRKSDEQWEEWKENLAEHRRCYYAMASHIDDKVGEIMGALERSGCADNTIVVFTSDHGEMFGAQGRIYKTTFYEEAIRVPFLMRWPGHIEAGSTSDVCLNTPDIAPTLLRLLGIAVPDEMEGMDLAQCALGEDGPEPEFAFLQGMGHTHLWKDGFEWRAVRTKRHIYARYLCDGSEHLYDLQDDPFQMTNLVDSPEHKEVLQSLRERMAQKMAELDDEFLPMTAYQSWMADDDIYSVVATAHGKHTGPHAPIPSIRAEQEERG